MYGAYSETELTPDCLKLTISHRGSDRLLGGLCCGGGDVARLLSPPGALPSETNGQERGLDYFLDGL